MEFSVPKLNQIISNFENSRKITDAELDWLENAVASGEVQGISRAGLPLLGMKAKTKLFESCFYQLESVRILMVCGRTARLQTVVEDIMKHLSIKCYGQFCPTGECFECSVCVLRFLRAVCPCETAWIAKIEDGIRVHFSDRMRTKATRRYVESTLE